MLLALATLVACGDGQEVVDMEAGDEPEFEGLVDVSHDAGEWQVGSPGGRLIMSTTSDPKTFNNIVANETSSTDITERLLAAAFRRNQFTLEFEPALAESYEISDDERTMTITLREGLLWSDGEPVTADDFVGAVNRVYYNEEVTGAGSTRNVLRGAGGDSIWEQVDELTFTVTLPNVYAGIFQLVSTPPLPMHIFDPLIEDEGAAAVDSFWGVDTDVTEIVSIGPWLVTEYEPGQRITLGRNPNYYETDAEGNQLPYLEEIVFQIVPDQDTQLQRFIAGELDYLSIRGEDYSVLVDRKEEIGFELYNVGPATSTNFLAFNQNPIEGEEDAGLEEPMLTWLSNKTFRTAMAHLIDRETIINNIAFGFGYPQYSFIPTFSPFYWEGAPEAAPEYDPDQAAELLDSIDYIDRDGDGIREDPDGNRISLTLSTNSSSSDRVSIVTQIAQEANAIGIEVVEDIVDFNALVGQLIGSYDWELVVIGLTGSIDPITSANVFPSSGNLHMIEPNQESPRRDWEARVDEAWEMASLTTDPQQRKEGYQIIQEIWLEELPWVFTFNAAIMHAYRDTLGNIYPHPSENFDWEGVLHRLYFVE
jgi:peptide/nickel transport system substrate-binding protein